MEDEAYRARNRTHDEIRQKGAIGNLNDGVEITTQVYLPGLSLGLAMASRHSVCT
jgi:hypothetical protein